MRPRMSIGGLCPLSPSFFAFLFRWERNAGWRSRANTVIGIFMRVSIRRFWRGICKRCLKGEVRLLEWWKGRRGICLSAIEEVTFFVFRLEVLNNSQYGSISIKRGGNTRHFHVLISCLPCQGEKCEMVTKRGGIIRCKWQKKPTAPWQIGKKTPSWVRGFT